MSLGKDEVAPDSSSPKPRENPNFPWFNMSENFKEGVTIICGDRRIIVRPATGEQGPEGPFPYITLMREGRLDSTKRVRANDGFCLHSEDAFNEIWNKLEEILG